MFKGKYIKTSQYATLFNMKQYTVTRLFHAGKIKGFQDPDTKTIFLNNPEYEKADNSKKDAILYARVSSTQNKKSLAGQLERMRNYASAKGYTIVDEVTEIGSGLNDHRPKLEQILRRDDYNILLVEHQDRLTRFGFNYIKTLLDRINVKVEVINKIEHKDDELMTDFISIVTSFCQRIYGRNRKKKTQQIIEDIKDESKR